MKSDLRVATVEEMQELDEKLAATGAGSFHMRQIRDAVARLRSDDGVGSATAGAADIAAPVPTNLPAAVTLKNVLLSLTGIQAAVRW